MSLASATIVGSENNLRVMYGDDKGLLVEFKDDAVYQQAQSDREGRAIYKEVTFIDITIPGDKTKHPYRPATDADKRRFPQQWAAYEAGAKAVAVGTPILEWTYLSKSQALELKHLGFATVDLLADASDMQLSNLASGNLLRKQAQEFLKSAKDTSAQTKLVAENEQLKNLLEALKTQNQALNDRLTTLEAKSDAPLASNKSTKKD